MDELSFKGRSPPPCKPKLASILARVCPTSVAEAASFSWVGVLPGPRAFLNVCFFHVLQECPAEG